jgi:hypothetical protein
MASKGYGNLWIMAIVLIAVFVVATVIAPELTGHGQTNTGDGWNTDMPSGAAIFYAPNTTLSASGLNVGQVVKFSVNADPVADTTGKGGIFAWIFQLEGASGRTDVADLKYDEGTSSVAWYPSSNGAVIGVGPRFIQGPGAASMPTSSSLSLALNTAGINTLKIWIATSSSTSDIDPKNYTSVSPMKVVTMTMAQEEEPSSEPGVSVSQRMSAPSALYSDEWSAFTARTAATGTGGWSDTIDVYISIEKNGIKTTDVSLQVSDGEGYSNVSFADNGNTLEALISSTSPLTGGADPESTSWSTIFQLKFAANGNYTLTSWAEDHSTGKELTVVTYNALDIQSHVVTPPEPTDPNSTNGTNGSVSSHLVEPTYADQVVSSAPVEQVAATSKASE